MMKELQRREYGFVTFGRDINIIRKLIVEKSNCYVSVWRGISKKQIYYECGHIYCDNYRQCFRPPLTAVKHLPQFYKVETSFEDGLCCDRSLPAVKVNDAPCFIGITKHNWLHQLKLKTGELIQKVYLTAAVRFRHISWETEGETIVLKSSLNQRLNSNGHRSFLCVLAYFKLYPLRFIGMMKVEPTVFGADISDAFSMDQILIISHRKGLIKLYSLKDALQEHIESLPKIQENLNLQYPNGLPFNISFDARPPVLFEIKCKGGDLQIGGFPWQLLTPYNNSYKVTILHTLDSAVIESTSNSVEPDVVMFHPSGSNHIVHITATELRILKPCYDHSNGNFKLTTLYKLCPENEAQPLADQIQVTRSGRQVKPQKRCEMVADLDLRSVLAFHYEHNLKMVCVLFAADIIQSSAGGQLRLYDSNTGDLLTSIPFTSGSWDEDTTHVIDIDVDVIIHISKSPRSFHLDVYRFINYQQETCSDN
ncbi:DDB1 and CUL4 associated factor 17 [Chamberlinius hualienensis]